MANKKYSQLDSQTQLNLIHNRIRDLETAELQLHLRINAPSPGDNVTQQDRDNLKQLQDSIKSLRDMEGEVSSSS